MNSPLVSVLMTAYNRENYLEDSIRSVLASTYHNFELIIVDDASTDNTVSLAEKFAKTDHRIKVFLNESNMGDYPNRNKAASYAKGKYLKYLDSDDIMYPHCLEVMVLSMEKFPEAGYGLCSISEKERPYPVCISGREAFLENFNGFGHFGRAPGSSIIKKTAFESVNGFTGERMIGDSQLWFALSMKYPLVKIQRDLVWDRVHPNQESQSAYSKKYEQLRKKVILDALADPECPLNESEKNKIRQSYFKSRMKDLFRKWI